MNRDESGPRLLRFGEFSLDVEARELRRNGVPVDAPPKLIDTLTALATHAGETITRENLLETVWPDTFVEEGNLTYTISLLRKLLGDQTMIKTVPRRGYRFDAKVTQVGISDDTAPGRPISVAKPAAYSYRWLIGAAAVVTLIASVFMISASRKLPPEPATASPNAEAEAAYTRGVMILAKKNVEDRAQRALDEFQHPVTHDPTFAKGYAGIAEGYSAAAIKSGHPESLDQFAKAKAAVDKALALDQNLAAAYLVRGWLRRNADWEWAEAEKDLRRSIELEPQNAVAHQRLAQVLVSLGRLDEALSEIRIAYNIAPIDDHILSGRFPILEARGEYARAVEESETFFRENKNNSAAARALATFLYHTGEFSRVIALGDAALQDTARGNAFAWHSLLEAAHRRTGNAEAAAAHLLELEKLAARDTKALYSLAMNYAELGRTSDALAELQKCLVKREERLAWLAAEPRFENLKKEKGFNDLIGRLNLR
jgi:DNA-binding winged helix-turn-helix (wHTH) protein/tetratricopeptide (TPR) repeat protein